MPGGLITLTTDFGEDSPYVAAMKGVMLAINPAVRLVDLSHQIPPQDLRHAAFFLQQAIPYFPPGSTHLVVVDPGVGTERAVLHVRLDGSDLVVPDNGCWTWIPCRDPDSLRVVRLTDPSFWRQPVSATFHGRDILAPAAAHLSLGVASRPLGVPVDTWVRLNRPSPRRDEGRVLGEVLFVDRFGNLMTNIPRDMVPPPSGPGLRVRVGGREVTPRWVHSYAAEEPGTLVALVSSADTLEIAVNQGSAAERLQARAGMPVEIVS